MGPPLQVTDDSQGARDDVLFQGDRGRGPTLVGVEPPCDIIHRSFGHPGVAAGALITPDHNQHSVGQAGLSTTQIDEFISLRIYKKLQLRLGLRSTPRRPIPGDEGDLSAQLKQKETHPFVQQEGLQMLRAAVNPAKTWARLTPCLPAVAGSLGALSAASPLRDHLPRPNDVFAEAEDAQVARSVIGCRRGWSVNLLDLGPRRPRIVGDSLEHTLDRWVVPGQIEVGRRFVGLGLEMDLPN